jgi:hypothetical protein
MQACNCEQLGGFSPLARQSLPRSSGKPRHWKQGPTQRAITLMLFLSRQFLTDTSGNVPSWMPHNKASIQYSAVLNALRTNRPRLRGGSAMPDSYSSEEEEGWGEGYFPNPEEGYAIDCEENLDKEVRVGWAPFDKVSVRVIPAQDGCLLGSDGKGWHGPIAEWFPSTLGDPGDAQPDSRSLVISCSSLQPPAKRSLHVNSFLCACKCSAERLILVLRGIISHGSGAQRMPKCLPSIQRLIHRIFSSTWHADSFRSCGWT